MRIILALCSIILAALLFGSGFYLGDSRARAEVALTYEKPAKDAAIAYLDAARREAEAEATWVAKQRKLQQRTVSRVEELEHALADRPHDVRCDLSLDELRDIGALRDIYREGRRAGLPDYLPGRPAGAESAEAIYSGSPALGLRVREPAR